MRIVERALISIFLMLAAASPAAAGWVMERVTHSEGGAGPGSEETLYIAAGRVKEVHADGTYFLWDVPRGLLFQVDPQARSYSGGPVTQMIADVRKYLEALRQQLARLSDEQREELARQTEGMPMPVPPPDKPPQWTVRKSDRKLTIAGHEARLFEIFRDGALFQEKWIATGLSFGKDLDYTKFDGWSRALESSFTGGMGGSPPEGKAIDELSGAGVELKSVLHGEGMRIITEVKRLEKRDIPDSAFHLPPDYILKDAQVS